MFFSLFPKFPVDVGSQLGKHTAVYDQLRAGSVPGGIASQVPCCIGDVFKCGNIANRGVVWQAVFAVVLVVFPSGGFNHSRQYTVGANAVFAPIHRKGFAQCR